MVKETDVGRSRSWSRSWSRSRFFQAGVGVGVGVAEIWSTPQPWCLEMPEWFLSPFLIVLLCSLSLVFKLLPVSPTFVHFLTLTLILVHQASIWSLLPFILGPHSHLYQILPGLFATLACGAKICVILSVTPCIYYHRYTYTILPHYHRFSLPFLSVPRSVTSSLNFSTCSPNETFRVVVCLQRLIYVLSLRWFVCFIWDYRSTI